ncbi:diguanylate cyclase domain-containing protein [Pelobacter propionicus]|uniref:diguanylate cyclase domain-containing protein n=1 Tax=Pelobacter propionicus TaxID=29543 RepID=UPI000057A9F4
MVFPGAGEHVPIKRKQADEQIRHMATHDGLTNLPPRNLAKEHLTMSLGVASRNKTMVTLMFIDLDGFKGATTLLVTMPATMY